jgi:FAD/FMN-containing dehydrogenase
MLPAMESTIPLPTDLSGRVSTAQDADWDTARQAFNLAVDQRPAAVVHPADVRDVIAVVAFAAENGLRVAPQSTGHGAGPLSLEDTLLMKTGDMRGVEIDAENRRARVLPGNVWGDVVPAAAEHGLAALHGSSPTVGVTGYTLGGGIGWYARKHGLAANSVTAVELITAEGEELRTDLDNEPELFWALRGGAGANFGVVTALEFDLFPVTEVYAGMLLFPWERSGEVLHAWNALLPALPDEITSLARILQVPDLPEIPEMVRGGKFVGFEAAYLGEQAEGEDLIAPIRALGADIDTFGMVPPPALSFLHMDPPEPVPGFGGNRLYNELSAQAIDELVDAAGPDSGSPLVSIELRHTGGALARSGDDHGALATLDGSICMFAVGMAMDESSVRAVSDRIELVKGTLRQHDAGAFLNFTEQPVDPAGFFTEPTYRRLQQVRAELDPNELFRANHRIAPAS